MSTINPTAEASSLPAFSASGILKVLGSLRLTVVLFALSLVIVMVGTLAQDEMNMLEVKQRYFLSDTKLAGATHLGGLEVEASPCLASATGPSVCDPQR